MQYTLHFITQVFVKKGTFAFNASIFLCLLFYRHIKFIFLAALKYIGFSSSYIFSLNKSQSKQAMRKQNMPFTGRGSITHTNTMI